MKFFTFLSAALLISGSSFATEYKIGDLKIDHPFARSTHSAQTSGVVYLRIENKGAVADKLIGASSPITKQIEVHRMTMEGDIMRMRQEDSLTIAAKSTLNMESGKGYHLMLVGLQQQLRVGNKFPMQLQFEKAGKLDITVRVEAAKPDFHAH